MMAANAVLLSPAGGARGPLYLEGWDLAILGDEKLPGKTRVTRGGVKVKKDPKKKAGSDGSTPTFRGLDLQEIELEVTVWTDEQKTKLDEVLDRFAPRRGVKVEAIPLQHEALRPMGAWVMVTVDAVSEYQIATDYGVSGRR